MSLLTAKQQKALKEAGIQNDILMTAALAAFWAASAQFNSALHIPINTQNLGDVTDAIGGEDNTKELDELLQGLDVLTSMGGDAISSIFAALVGTGLIAGYTHFRFKTLGNDHVILFSKAAFGAMLGKSVAYIGAKEITALIAHTISVVNPLMHIPMSITFAIFYGLFSTLFAEYAKYKAIKPIKDSLIETAKNTEKETAQVENRPPNFNNIRFEPYTFRQHMSVQKGLLKDFCTNCMTGLALYGSTLIPGLSTVESVATTVAITSATAGGTRAAWAIAAPRSEIKVDFRGLLNDESRDTDFGNDSYVGNSRNSN